jgi:hypothetical protein
MACAADIGEVLISAVVENPLPGTIATVGGLSLATDKTLLMNNGQRVSRLPLYYGMDLNAYSKTIMGSKYLNMAGNSLWYSSYGLSAYNYTGQMKYGDYTGARKSATTAFYGALMMSPPYMVTIPVGLVGIYVFN